MTRQIVERLFRAAIETYGTVTVAHLRSIVRTLDFSSHAERMAALELVGAAHICTFDHSPRDATHAIPFYVESGAWESLMHLVRIALDRGNTRLAHAALEALAKNGQQRMSREEFAVWFLRRGIFWFDVFVDRTKGVAYIHDEDRELFQQVIHAHSDHEVFWRKVLSSAHQDPDYPDMRRCLLEKMAAGEDVVVDLPLKTRYPARTFEAFAREQGIEILRVLQRREADICTESDVVLARDSDGIVKVFKRLLTHGSDPVRGGTPHEGTVLNRLGTLEHVVGTTRCVQVAENLYYAVLPVVYAREYEPGGHGRTWVASVSPALRDAVRGLAAVHARKVMHGDVRPENILATPERAHLIDFGSARVIEGVHKMVPVYLEDRRFATPECVRVRRGGLASDVFQLSTLIAWEMIGQHPFALSDELQSEAVESEILRMAWPLMVGDFLIPEAKALPQVVQRGLSLDPRERPLLSELEGGLTACVGKATNSARKRVGAPTVVDGEPGRPMVIFPARMGIPHAGHIEYVRRLIMLGFHVRISLQRAYTCTERDPIPKWLVQKMVARSLLNAGCDVSDFSFIFTPYFERKEEMLMHFALMPDRERISAVASSNPGVRDLFPQVPILDQASVFGQEGVPYVDRSWGEKLRRAVREGDVETFLTYAASGVTSIRTFEELRWEYGDPAIPFVDGKVSVILATPWGAAENVRVLRYLGPEQSVVRHLGRQGREVVLSDPYARISEIVIDREVYQLHYENSTFNGADLVCSFAITRP